MTPSTIEKLPSLKILMVLTLGILVVVLYFGLKAEPMANVNLAERLIDRPGIGFGPGGSVHSQARFNAGQLLDPADTEQFSLEIALKPTVMDENGFRFIFCLHNGNDDSQLVMGQWRSQVIVMNGDDYAHRRKIPRVSANLADDPSSPHLLTISSSPKGTIFFLDGKAVRKSGKLSLKLPAGDRVQMILGNSVYGTHAWQGEIYGLAIYGRALRSSEAARHFAYWQENQNLPLNELNEATRPAFYHALDDAAGARIFTPLAGDLYLDMPARNKILVQKFLARDLSRFHPQRLDLKDLLVNFFGFIPLGVVLVLLGHKMGGKAGSYAFPFAVAGCFLVSLGIELAQAWIPMRLSDLFDLLLNTGGGMAGALAGALIIRLRGNW
jgi:VanZ family protein